MKYCKKCLYPDTKPQLIFDEKGVCSACTNNEMKDKIDWDRKKEEFHQIIEKYRSKDHKNYDCIIPVSGGKDSTYQTYIMKKEFGLNPLVVNFHPLDQTEIGKKNLENLKRIGVDCIEFTANPEIYLKLARYGLTELGDFQWPEHIGIFTVPVQIAVRYNIPLIIWGENPQLEYGGNKKERLANNLDLEWISRHGVTNSTSLKDWIGQQGLTSSELEAYRLPTKEQLDLFNPRSIFLGSYFKWNSWDNAELAKQHGFESNPIHLKTGLWHFADVDCNFISIHHYLKWFKFGITRSFDNLSLEIRQGFINRNTAIKKLTELGLQQPYEDITKFCEFTGKTQKWFWDVAESHRNKEVWKLVDGTWKIPDFLIEDWEW